MSSLPHRRRLRAWFLTLTAVAMIAAAVIPTCADSLCCALSGEPKVKAQMPCCEPSISAGDLELQVVTVEERQSCLSGQAGLPLLHHVANVVAETLPPPPAPHHEPPLFLLNAQFLI